jgi:hypothetical protein
VPSERIECSDHPARDDEADWVGSQQENVSGAKRKSPSSKKGQPEANGANPETESCEDQPDQSTAFHAIAKRVRR